jgi:hypothetical protein
MVADMLHLVVQVVGGVLLRAHAQDPFGVPQYVVSWRDHHQCPDVELAPANKEGRRHIPLHEPRGLRFGPQRGSPRQGGGGVIAAPTTRSHRTRRMKLSVCSDSWWGGFVAHPELGGVDLPQAAADVLLSSQADLSAPSDPPRPQPNDYSCCGARSGPDWLSRQTLRTWAPPPSGRRPPPSAPLRTHNAKLSTFPAATSLPCETR